MTQLTLMDPQMRPLLVGNFAELSKTSQPQHFFYVAVLLGIPS